jgi:hypothetical protein
MAHYLKNMKINVEGSFGSRTHIVNTLLQQGYVFGGDASVYNDAKALFTYNTGIIMKTDDMGYFKRHPNTEYVLSDDKFVMAKDYYKQPETTYTPLSSDGTQALIAKQKAVADKILDKLFPIDPFAICAGGAPRDWHFGKPATDIDIFFHTSVDQLTIVEEMLKHVGIKLDGVRHAESLPEWYKLNPALKCVYECTVDGVSVQLMFMNAKTQDAVVPQFPFSICKAWYKHGKITLDSDFKKCEKHKIVVQTNNLYSDEHKYVQKIKAKFPDYEFFSTWEDAYKYVFEKGSV